MNRDELAHELWAAAHLAPGEGISDAVARMISLLAAQPADAEGVEVIAYATPNEDGDWQMLFFDEKEAIQYVDDEPPAPLVLQSAHLAALSAVTADRDRLLAELERAYANYNQVSYASTERGKQIDQLRAEVEKLRSRINEH